jgi:putative DNA primase/helicase
MVKNISLIIENTPPCLRVCCRWVAWQNEERDGKMTKVPYDANTGRRASSTDPSTWTTFEQAVEAFARNERYDGGGYVFSAGDPFCGVDLDDSLDPATNELKP